MKLSTIFLHVSRYKDLCEGDVETLPVYPIMACHRIVAVTERLDRFVPDRIRDRAQPGFVENRYPRTCPEHHQRSPPEPKKWLRYLSLPPIPYDRLVPLMHPIRVRTLLSFIAESSL